MTTTSNEKKFLKLADRLSYVPSYIFAKLDTEKHQLVNKGIDVIDLSLGSPDLPSPESVIEECIKSVKDPKNYRYPPFGGQIEFKKAASEWMKKRFSVDLNYENEILPLSGSKEGITHLAFALINPGETSIVPSPYYPVHARGTLLAGGKVYELALLEKNHFLPDLDSIPQEILNKAKMFFISYPNNPTGATCTVEFLEKVAYICKKNQILLVSDLAYSELSFDGHVASSVLQIKGTKDFSVEFHTFSKTYSMAGWRIAFVCGNKDAIKALYEIKTNTDYGVCNITQSASIKAFSIPLSEHKKTSLIYQERRDAILEKLKLLGWNILKPGGAMYIWLPIPKSFSSSFEFSSALLHKAHVATIPGGSFGTYGEGYIRIALVDKKERLVEAVERMKKAGLVLIQFILVMILVFSSLPSVAKKPPLPQVLNYEIALELHKKGDLKSAILYLNNELKLNPTHLPSLIELGEVYIELNQYDLATSILKTAGELNPDDALVQLLLGISYEKNKQFNEAITHFKQAIKLEPENVLIRINLGQACFLVSDYKCAIDNLGKVVLAYPNELKARALLGVVYHANKDYAFAKEQYKFVLNYEPNNVTLWYNLAKTHLALGEYKEAKASLDKAILIDNSIVDLYLDRAQINYKLNKLSLVENDYLSAISVDPVNPEVPLEYANFLWKTGAYLKASEQLTKALSLDPDNLSLLINKAYLLQLAKKENDATLVWQEVLKKDTKNKFALLNLAKLFQDKNDFTNAVELYRKVLSLQDLLKEDILETKSALAYCLQKDKNLAEAKIIYEGLLKENPEDSQAQYNLGVLLIKEKDYKSACEHLEEALKYNFSPLGKPYEALVEAYSQLNDTDKIKSTYKNWLGTDKNNAEVRIEYAKFLAKQGDSQGAIDQYRIAAALDDTNKSRYKLAQFLLEQKDLYGAVGQLQEYLKSDPNDLNALILLANTFKDLGIIEQAVNVYKKIVSIQSDNHLAYYNLGLLYQKNEKYEDAQNSLLKVIEINENYAPAYYALGLSYLSDSGNELSEEKRIKAKELFEKYLKLDPKGEYKEKVEAKLKELIGKPAVNQPPV